MARPEDLPGATGREDEGEFRWSRNALPNDPNLKRASLRGGLVTAGAQSLKFILRFGSTAVLARYLAPGDFGLIAMTAVITGFVGMFKDAGLTTATIQAETVTRAQARSLFWINTFLGLVLTAVLMLLSPLVALFYGEPRLMPVTCALASTFIFGGLTVQHQALLRRQMRFRALAAAELISLTVASGIGIAMALYGFEYWSLVGLAIGYVVANAVVVWILVPWWPGWFRRGSSVKSFLKFGSDVLAFDTVNYFSRQADNLLIGWSAGPAPLGLYEKAYSLLLLPISQINAPINAVLVPALSRTRAVPDQFNGIFLGSVEMVAAMTLPIIAGLTLFAHEVVLLWLGAQWIGAASIFQLLAVAAALGALSNPIGWILISTGQTRKYRLLGLYTAPCIVLAFFLGLKWGPQGVAAAYSVVMLVIFTPAWSWALQGSSIRLTELFKRFCPALAASGMAALLAFAGRAWLTRYFSSLVSFGISFAIFSLAYSACYLFVMDRWRHVAQVYKEAFAKAPADKDLAAHAA